jgi:hypothetical protein
MHQGNGCINHRDCPDQTRSSDQSRPNLKNQASASDQTGPNLTKIKPFNTDLKIKPLHEPARSLTTPGNPKTFFAEPILMHQDNGCIDHHDCPNQRRSSDQSRPNLTKIKHLHQIRPDQT